MNYEKIAEIIENEIDNFKDSFIDNDKTTISHEDILKLNKSILDKIADLFPEKKYKLINNNDGNDEIKLESTDLEDVYEEALEKLGWTLFINEDEED